MCTYAVLLNVKHKRFFKASILSEFYESQFATGSSLWIMLLVKTTVQWGRAEIV